MNVRDYQNIATALKEQREEIGGVSLNEEAIKLMETQKAYNAAARIVTAADEMLDRVINGMGRVGI
jgi:flagellar hook-associated protein 1 FlgK